MHPLYTCLKRKNTTKNLKSLHGMLVAEIWPKFHRNGNERIELLSEMAVSHGVAPCLSLSSEPWIR